MQHVSQHKSIPRPAKISPWRFVLSLGLATSLCAAVILSLGLSGCAYKPALLGFAAPAQPIPRRAYLVHLPGIGGAARIDDWMVKGLRDGGLESDVFIFNWVGQDRGLASLVRYEKNRTLAKELSERIVGIIQSHPNERVIISGHSGGNGILVWALEDLPPGVMVDSAVLLSPALSPDYDLSRALSHVQRAYSFHSEADDLVLGWGTETFGTMDGKRTAAAGMVGFVKPAQADAQQYSKLQQFAYDASWSKWGNHGGHIDDMREPFARAVLAPLLLHGRLPTTQETHD